MLTAEHGSMTEQILNARLGRNLMHGFDELTNELL